jgi:alkanesulfonate monooxygenase SsuD/methylene tetrahydromethanopterin reductase-like flavin-dependent oxidoreductase (luciferase family)
MTAPTSHLRLGDGVPLLRNPTEAPRHPVRTAERVALLDDLCEGRGELGTWRSGKRRRVSRERPSALTS